ncbi:diguanylate cyclase [Wenjunlia vitaminophila]|uniref:Diguanylate cyclase n=1 Tax=Wenjunlia vitaminophila TaxID=76728 RepID=A0A0T6LMG5_WENVI|nr:diguanylate cyclase [Wenjunlia vitaminophila]
MPADERLQAVAELARALAGVRDPLQAVLAAVERVRLALGGSMAAISRWERERGRLRVLVNSGDLAWDEEEVPPDETYPIGDFPDVVRFLRQRWSEGAEPRAWVETADGAGRAPGPYTHQRIASLRRRGRSSCLVAPILLHGFAWGELYVARGPTQPVFDGADEEFATALASLIAAGIAQTEHLAEVRRLAFTDPLTGLANRRAVDVRLDEALRRHEADGTVVTLGMCDVNGLKTVNDEFGHETGDELLASFAHELSLCAAKLTGCVVARLGGDEFCLVAEGHSPDEVLRVADEVCRRARLLPYADGVACGVASTADVGPVSGPGELFRLADAAQYLAKKARSAHPVRAGRDTSVRDLPEPAPGRPERERRRYRDAPRV